MKEIKNWNKFIKSISKTAPKWFGGDIIITIGIKRGKTMLLEISKCKIEDEEPVFKQRRKFGERQSYIG